MVSFTLRFPTEEEDELVRRFAGNRNYLHALASFVGNEYGKREELYHGLKTTLEATPKYQKINRADVPLTDVRRFLTLGWSSEIQLHLPAILGQPGMLAFANTWAPVHAYYAVYGALQAWFATNGMSGLANDHTATLRTIANQIKDRDLLPEPWNLLAVGCPMRDEKIHLNDRGVDCVSHVEVLSTPIPLGVDNTFWPRIGTWLRSTREARLTSRETQWKKQNGKARISPAERTKFAASLAPTSLFDCLWRLRIKSNYGSVDPYLVTFISDTDHLVFNRSLNTFVRASLSILELLTLRRIGAQRFADIASDFVSQDTHGLSDRLLTARLSAYGL